MLVKKYAGEEILLNSVKYAGEDILVPLYAMFNYTLASGQYPQPWTDGIINPIHNSGETSKPDNYRKITIMPSIGKLLEGILNRRLYYKNEVLEHYDDLQRGFKDKSQTMDNIFIFYKHLLKNKKLKINHFTCALWTLPRHLTTYITHY